MTQMKKKTFNILPPHLTSPTCQGNSPTAACVPPTILLEEELTPHWQLPEDHADYGDAMVTIGTSNEGSRWFCNHGKALNYTILRGGGWRRQAPIRHCHNNRDRDENYSSLHHWHSVTASIYTIYGTRYVDIYMPAYKLLTLITGLWTPTRRMHIIK